MCRRSACGRSCGEDRSRLVPSIGFPVKSVFAHEGRWQRALLWCGVVAPVLRHVAIYGVGAATPNYDATTDFISEIGALDAPYRIVMNTLGIGFIGVMMLLASTALFTCLRPLAGGRASALLLGLSGSAFILVALFPCDPGCAVSSPLNLRMVVHLFSGFVAMGAEVIAAVTPGLLQLRRGSQSQLGRLALVLGLIGVAAYLLLLSQTTNLAYAGLVQRVVQAAGDGWLFAASVACLRRRPVPARTT